MAIAGLGVCISIDENPVRSGAREFGQVVDATSPSGRPVGVGPAGWRGLRPSELAWGSIRTGPGCTGRCPGWGTG